MNRPRKGWSLMASVLGATDALVRGLAVDLAPIRVNVVCPGTVDTEVSIVDAFSETSVLNLVLQLWKNVDPAKRQGFFEAAAKRLLVGHIGDPDDVAETYLFLMKYVVKVN